MVETVIRKRIEILADNPLVRRVTHAIDKAEITGWSIIPIVAGSGRDGAWHEERVVGADKSLIVTIGSAEKAARLTEALLPILSSHGLLLTQWDVEVIRGDRF